jgi:hypothetical protein
MEEMIAFMNQHPLLMIVFVGWRRKKNQMVLPRNK